MNGVGRNSDNTHRKSEEVIGGRPQGGGEPSDTLNTPTPSLSDAKSSYLISYNGASRVSDVYCVKFPATR